MEGLCRHYGGGRRRVDHGEGIDVGDGRRRGQTHHILSSRARTNQRIRLRLRLRLRVRVRVGSSVFESQDESIREPPLS